MSCQNFRDGGFSLIPGLESHGGATYCAVASLYILGKTNIIPHKTRLIKWLVGRLIFIFIYIYTILYNKMLVMNFKYLGNKI